MSVYGTARFANEDDLTDARLIHKLYEKDWSEGLLIGQWFGHPHYHMPIHYGGDLHQLVVAGTGGGKFTTAIAPMLFGNGYWDEQTVVAVDPKGEIANLVGPYFERPFNEVQNVYLLDPWDECKTGSTSALNVLADLTLENPNCVDDARALADAMIIPSGGDNRHWDSAGRNLLTTILLYVALHPDEKGRRHLNRVREIVTLTWQLPKAFRGPRRENLSELMAKMSLSELAGGTIKRGASGLFNREDKERSGILSSVERDTAWIDSPQMARVLQGPSLDLKKASLGGHKYFIVLPPEFFATHRAWLRLMITAFATAFKRHRPSIEKPQHERWRHIIIDEFANLGEMSFIQNDVAVARGFDVKYHLIVQDLAQLEALYKNAWQSFINNTFQRFFAVRDMFTAKYVSDMLGSATVANTSTSSGRTGSDSVSTSQGTSLSQGVGLGNSQHPSQHSITDGTSYSVSQTSVSGWSHGSTVSSAQRPLLTPDEVRRLPADEQLIFMRGLPAIRAGRKPYWQMFKNVPLPFDLKAIWGTIGRISNDAAESSPFLGPQLAVQYIWPERLPKEVPALPPPAPKEPKWYVVHWQLLASVIAVLLAAFAAWCFLSALYAPPPERPKPRVQEEAPAPIVTAPTVVTPPVAALPPPPPVPVKPTVQTPPPQSRPNDDVRGAPPQGTGVPCTGKYAGLSASGFTTECGIKAFRAFPPYPKEGMTFVATIQECAAACGRDSACKTFSYKVSNDPIHGHWCMFLGTNPSTLTDEDWATGKR